MKGIADPHSGEAASSGPDSGNSYTCCTLVGELRGPGAGVQGRDEAGESRARHVHFKRNMAGGSGGQCGFAGAGVLPSLQVGDLSQDEAWASRCHYHDNEALHRTLCTRLGGCTGMYFGM